MHYYQVEFSHPLLLDGESGNSDLADSRNLSSYEKKIEGKLKEIGFEFRHCYSWPEGGIYTWIKTNLGIAHLYDLLQAAISDDEIDISSVSTLRKSHKTHKIDFKGGGFVTIEMAFKRCRFARKT